MISITEIHPMLVHFPIVLWISAATIAVRRAIDTPALVVPATDPNASCAADIRRGYYFAESRFTGNAVLMTSIVTLTTLSHWFHAMGIR